MQAKLLAALVFSTLPLLAQSSGFDHQYVALAVYSPSRLPGDIIGFEGAPVIPGLTTFPSLAASQFAQPGTPIVNCNVTLSGTNITFSYPASEAGTRFLTGAFNGYVFYTYSANNSPLSITGASLTSTNVVGLTSSDLTFSANTIMLNVSGTSLPSGAAGSIKIKVSFGAAPPPPNPGDPAALVPPSKSEADQRFYKNLAVAYLSSSVYFAAGALVAPQPDAALFTAISALFATTANTLGTEDPVDLNFGTIATPNPPANSPLPSGPFSTATTGPILTDIQSASNQIIGLANAAQTSLNRASGAFISNDPQAELNQLNALNTFVQQEIAASTRIGNDIVQLANAMPSGSGFDQSQLLALANDFLSSSSASFLPSISAGGVVPVFSSSTTIQPGSWVSIYGDNLANTTAIWNGDFPTSLGNTEVTIDGKPAFHWYVSPTQINVQAPNDATIGVVPVKVTTPTGISLSSVTLGPYGPSFSLFDSEHPAAIVPTTEPGNSGAGYDYIGPASAFSFPSRPVKAGETVVLYGVGFGPTTEPVPAGVPFSSAAPCITKPIVTIGGVTATVTFAGIVEAGLYQLNVVVPTAGSGDKLLKATAGNLSTQANVYLTLQ